MLDTAKEERWGTNRTLSGQPMIENGQRPDENHVSSTSSSCSSVNLALPAIFFARSVASSSVRPTTHFDSSCCYSTYIRNNI
jgi:hypothetical protein